MLHGGIRGGIALVLGNFKTKGKSHVRVRVGFQRQTTILKWGLYVDKLGWHWDGMFPPWCSVQKHGTDWTCSDAEPSCVLNSGKNMARRNLIY